MQQNLIDNGLLKILACPVCSNSITLRDKSLQCTNCATSYKIDNGIPIMFPPTMPKEQMIAIHVWGEEYRSLLKNQIYEYRDQYGLKDYEILKRYYVVNKGDLFLELGCGRGRVSLMLAKDGLTTVGLDVSIDALKLAKKIFEHNNERGWFVCGDILNPPIKKCSLDLVFAGGSMEHFKDTKEGVAKTCELIKPTGLFVATVPYVSISTLAQGFFTGNVPDVSFLREFYYFVHFKILKQRKLMYGYEKSFTAGSLVKIFKEVGFSNVVVGPYETEYTLKFFPKFTKKFIQQLIRCKLFWPVIYLSARK